MTAAKAPRLAGEWAVFVQPYGPNTQPEYLGCHDFGDIEQEEGDLNLLFCPGDYANEWDVVSSYQGEPGAAKFDITTTIRKVRDSLQKVKCPVPFYLLDITCGKKNVFTNWQSQAIIPWPARRVKKQWQGLAKRVPGDQTESTRVFSFSAEGVLEPYKPKIGRQGIAETAALLDIAFCNVPKCADACGTAAEAGEDGVVVSESPVGSPAANSDLWHTANSGEAWAVANPGPFAAGEDAIAVECFEVDANTTRYLVARGTADMANPMEVAYRDGLTGAWTYVNVGTVNGQYALGPYALFALDMNHIWLVTTGGYVYFSSDGGLNWDAQQEGLLTVNNLWAVHSDGDNIIAVGAADTILLSNDAGASWVVATATGSGDVLSCAHLLDQDKMWIGTNGGELYYTHTGGAAWAARAFTGSGAGMVPGVVFFNELVGYMIHNTAAPVGTVFMTINGGYNWQAITTPSNAGLTSITVPALDLAYATGNPSGGTAVVLKIAPA